MQEALTGYGNALARHGLSDSAPAFDRRRTRRDLVVGAAVAALARRFGYPADWIGDGFGSLSDLSARFQRDGFDPPHDDPWTDQPVETIYARRRLELQLAYDEPTERWCLVVALVHGAGPNVFNREGAYGLKRYGKPFEPSYNLGWDEWVVPPCMSVGSLFVQRVAAGRFMAFAVQDEDVPEEIVLGMESGCLTFPSEPSLEALFTAIEDNEVDGHLIDAPLDRFWNRPAPAGNKTLAGMILRNLAYAPDDERYDLRLLADAKAKAKLVADFAKDREETFLKAIKRIER